MKNRIKMYCHCQTCEKSGSDNNLGIGLSDEQTITVWCDNCDKFVISFTITPPVTMPVDGETNVKTIHH